MTKTQSITVKPKHVWIEPKRGRVFKIHSLEGTTVNTITGRIVNGKFVASPKARIIPVRLDRFNNRSGGYHFVSR